METFKGSCFALRSKRKALNGYCPDPVAKQMDISAFVPHHHAMSADLHSMVDLIERAGRLELADEWWT